MTTITAAVLVVLSVLNHLQVFKQAAIGCTSKLYHRIALIRAWVATSVISYIACREVLAILALKPTAIAKYRQAICNWLMHDYCSSSSSEHGEDTEVELSVSLLISCIMATTLGLPVAGMIGWLVYDLAFEYWSVCANLVTDTCRSKATLWRQQRAYMIQSSYSEGSAIKRKTIDAYLKKNCYIQVLQPVDKSSAAAVAAVKAALEQKRLPLAASLIHKFDGTTDDSQKPPCKGIDATQPLINALLTDQVAIAFIIAFAVVSLVVAVKLAVTLW
jgi:hypothetical protein